MYIQVNEICETSEASNVDSRTVIPIAQGRQNYTNPKLADTLFLRLLAEHTADSDTINHTANSSKPALPPETSHVVIL